MPPEFMEGLLHGIESTVMVYWKEYPKLTDKDVEFVYSKLENYYRIKSTGKAIDEPEVTSQFKQDLIDEILNSIDLREELKGDIMSINNPDCTLGGKVIPSLPFLYANAFKRLIKSARNWRKRNGSTGYLTFIKGFLV